MKEIYLYGSSKVKFPVKHDHRAYHLAGQIFATNQSSADTLQLVHRTLDANVFWCGEARTTELINAYKPKLSSHCTWWSFQCPVSPHVAFGKIYHSSCSSCFLRT